MKTLKLKFLSIFFLILLFCSCDKKIKKNDDFRNNVISKIKLQKDTLKIFENLLGKLDEKNVTFGDYTKNILYKIPDSCSIEANKKFKVESGYGDLTPEMYDYSDRITNNGRIAYNSRFNIDQKTADISTFIVVSYPEIKKYLNKNFGLHMYIQDEN